MYANFSKQTVLEEWMAEDGFTNEHLIMFATERRRLNHP